MVAVFKKKIKQLRRVAWAKLGVTGRLGREVVFHLSGIIKGTRMTRMGHGFHGFLNIQNYP